jgi:hypothetical protein
MKAILLKQYGGPEQLSEADIPKPERSALLWGAPIPCVPWPEPGPTCALSISKAKSSLLYQNEAQRKKRACEGPLFACRSENKPSGGSL